MNIQVTPHTIAITINTNINAGEYNITPCEFTFTEEYEDLTKEAIFSSCDGLVFKVSILNNQCTIPYEVLQQEGNVLLGVYAYETNDDELVLRYSPTPQYFNVKRGSFQVGNDPDLPSPTEWERVLEQINQAIEETNNLNITANKEGKITTVTITKKDGTTQEVEINDGKDLEFNWEGTSLGVRQEGQSEYEYTDLKGAKGDTGATPNIQIGDVQTGDSSEVTRTGTDENPIFNFTLEKGDTGNGIASITKTSTSGLVDTYTITFTNGQTTTYQITNGANGSVVDVQVDGTSVVDNGIANIIGLTEMRQELEDMYNLLPKVQGTGETITLDNTVAGKMLLDLKGNTSQTQTTQSKNLLPNTATTQTINDLTFTVNNDKSISISGTPNATTTFSINTSNIKLPAGTYTMSTHKEGTTSGNAYINVRLADESANVTTINLHIASSSTFTLEQETELYVRVYSSSNITFTDFKIYPMIESGETVTDYVEFVPNSPSPDYPQDIHVVSGDNNIMVNGKNLYNATRTQETWRNLTSSADNQRVYVNGQISTAGGVNFPQMFVKAGTYRIMVELESGEVATTGTGNTAGLLFYLYSTTGGNGDYIAIKTDRPRGSRVVTFTKDTYMYLHLYPRTNETMTNAVFKYQVVVESGEPDWNFVPYKATQTYPINLGVENRFNTNGLNQGQYNANASLLNNRITWYGKQITSGDTITVVCNNSNLRFNVGRTTMNTNNSSNVYSQESGWQTGTHTITYNSSGYACVIIAKVDNTDVSTSEIANNDFTISYNGEYISSTPIELCKIGDYQDSIKKSTGKNLFDKNNDITVNTGLTSDGGTFSSNDYCMKGWLELKANTQYTLSDNDNTKTKRICFYSDKTESSFISVVEQVNKSVTFTTPANCKYVRIQIKQTELNYEMLNEGSTALSYEPYGKVWYKYEIISKYIINSSNDFRLYDATNYPGRFYRDNFWTSSYPSNLGYMTHFKRETYTTGFGILSDGSFAIQTPNHRLWIINLSTPTLEEFNTWLSTNNVTFYRVLKTPTYTEITDSTLISQLETIKRSYNGQTNISQTNDDKPFILDVTALKELTQ